MCVPDSQNETQAIDYSVDLSFSSVKSSDLSAVHRLLSNSNSTINIRCCNNSNQVNETTCGNGKPCKDVCPVPEGGELRQEEVSTVFQNIEDKGRDWCNLVSDFRGQYSLADLSHCRHSVKRRIEMRRTNVCPPGWKKHPSRPKCYKSDQIR